MLTLLVRYVLVLKVNVKISFGDTVSVAGWKVFLQNNVLSLWGYSSVLRASLKCMVSWIICSVIPTAVNVPCPNFNVVDCFIFYLFPLVTVDYKTLILLLAKIGNLEFQLGGRGVAVEFCFICNAIRVSINVLWLV